MQVDPSQRPTDGTFSYDLAGEFAAAMTDMAVSPGAHIAVAVSGGADSMALALLLAQWSRGHNVTLQALTVDHGLRDAAADEAKQVAAWLSPLRVPHTTLPWEEGRAYRTRPASAQSAARDARYALMTDWCAAHNATHLFLAHHADDQAETFLQRLARGSGVDGLAAMAPRTARAGIVLARPLIAVPKARLLAYCREAGQPWIEDPSNVDETYGRVRMRAARDVLAREGLSPDRILATADHMRRARAALDHYVGALLSAACTWDSCGVGRLNLTAFLAAPDEIALRALAAVLMTGSGQGYRPRFERLVRLYDSLRAGPWRDATLHGCMLLRVGATLVIVREAAQVGDEQRLRPGVKALWDGRFELEVAGLPPAREFRVRRLYQREVPAQVRETETWAKMPLQARETLPALFDSEGLAAAPALNFTRPDLATFPGVTISAAFKCPRIDEIPEDDAEL